MAAEAGLTGTVAIDGLATVLSALSHIEKSLARELRAELARVAEQDARYAVYIAHEKGLYDPAHEPDGGGLISSIHAGARSSYAYITATARRVSKSYPAGFNYPAVYEYAGSATRKVRGIEYKIRNRSKLGIQAIANYGVTAGHIGPRAFLEPAAIQGEPLLEQAIEDMFTRLTSEAGLGMGGVL